MRYILAFDSFKGAANSAELNAAAAQAIIDLQPDAEIIAIDIADGGEGFAQSFAASLHSGVKQIECPTVDPLGRPITATYFRHGNQAIMELAAASGLPLLAESERNPMIASTSGTGLMMRHAISAGCGEILLGIGGSATNDAATGILAALGFEFLDNEGNVITPNGENLARIARIKNPDTKFPKIKIACDVSNPFCGPKGAAYIYAAQKGASKSDIALLDKGLWQFAQVINRQYNTDITNLPGAGAAGGVGGALHAILNANLRSGIDMLLDAHQFDSLINEPCVIITGEGKFDRQSMMGKAIHGIIRRAGRPTAKVLALCGAIDYNGSLPGNLQVLPITPQNTPLPQALAGTIPNLKKTITELFGISERE